MIKKMNKLVVALLLLTINSYADEVKTKIKEPVELVFDTKVSCKDLKPYLEFIDAEMNKQDDIHTTFCANDDTDGELTIVDKDTDNPKIIHEPTNTVFSEFVSVSEKLYGGTKDHKANIQPFGIAYADLDDDGVDEIFIADYTQYDWFGMNIIKNNNGKFELFKNNMKVENKKIVILPTKTNGFHDIFYQTLNVKKKKGAVWKYEKNLEYNLDNVVK